MQALKLVVIGPIRSGKTTISNFLAEATEMPYDYHPTQGVRILEFEMQNIQVNGKHITKDIELWDCSGDHKFRNCWPAMRKDLHGVIFVYSANSEDSLKELQEFYEYFVNQIKLSPDRCVIFCFDPEKKQPEISKTISSTFAKISHVKCNVGDGGNKLKSDFSSFISTLMNKMQEYINEKHQIPLKDNILFAK